MYFRVVLKSETELGVPFHRVGEDQLVVANEPPGEPPLPLC